MSIPNTVYSTGPVAPNSKLKDAFAKCIPKINNPIHHHLKSEGCAIIEFVVLEHIDVIVK